MDSITKKETKSGTVKRIIRDKGFGFIVSEAAEGDVFFHFRNSAIPLEEMSEGDEVTFEIYKNDKGWNAVNVRHYEG